MRPVPGYLRVLSLMEAAGMTPQSSSRRFWQDSFRFGGPRVADHRKGSSNADPFTHLQRPSFPPAAEPMELPNVTPGEEYQEEGPEDATD